MKKHKSSLWLLILLLAFSFSSCLVDPPLIPDSGGVAYQKPKSPENIEVVSGGPKISISWDSVENATRYGIFGKQISQSDESYKLLAEVFSSGQTGERVSASIDSSKVAYDKDQRYLFRIKAYIDYSQDSSVTLSSDYSVPVEGAFEPEGIQFHVVVTDKEVRAIWNVPNLISFNYEPLYDTEFCFSYKQAGESEAVEEILGSPESPVFFKTMNVNESLQQNVNYEFSITMTILDTEKTFTETKTILISSDTTPDAIASDDISVGQGTSISEILVSWLTPSWTLFESEESPEQALFTLERAEAGSDQWVVLADEISAQTDSELFVYDGLEKGRMRFHYSDASAAVGKKYIYRITNAACTANGACYISDEEPASSEEGYLYYPAASDLKGEWTASGAYNANVKLSYGLIEPDVVAGVSLAVEKEVYEYSSGEVEYSLTDSFEFSESISDGYFKYSYSLVLVKPDNSVYLNLGSFIFNVDTSLGTTDGKPLFRSFAASNDMIGEIKVSWEELENVSAYSYSLNGSDYASISNIVEENGYKYFIYEVQEEESIWDFKLKADEYESPYSVSGSIYSIPESIGFNASKAASASMITLTWNKDSSVPSGIIYGYQEKQDDGSWSVPATVDYQAGMYYFDLSKKNRAEREKQRTYRLVAYNQSQYQEDPSAIVYTAEDMGYVLSSPSGISASKGDYVGRVRIAWSPVEGATGYEIFRYSNIDECVSIGTAASDSTEYFDTMYNSSMPYYTVSALKEDVSSYVQDDFGTITNHIYASEAANWGYPFDETGVSGISVLSSIDSDNYFNDYLTISFSVNKTATQYVIYSTYGPSVTIDSSSLALVGDTGLYTNGKSSNEMGYVGYNPADGKLTANVNVGIIDDDLAIKKVSIIGQNKQDVDNCKTMEASLNGVFRRGLNEYDYIYLFNKTMSRMLSVVDNSFEGDWYGRDPTVYDNGSTLYVKSAYSTFMTDRKYPGYIQFKGYRDDVLPVVLTSKENGNISLIHRDEGSLGYLGTDPLDKIGVDEENETVLVISSEYAVSGQQAKFKDATISLKDVLVAGGGGSYTVTTSDWTKAFDDNDYVLVKPFIKGGN